MNKLLFQKLVITFCVLFITSSLHSQDVVVIKDTSESTIAFISIDGEIKNSNGQQIAKVELSGEVKDASDQLLVTISGNEIKNSSNILIGKIQYIEHGRINLLDNQDNQICKIEYSSKIYNSNGDLLFVTSDAIIDLYLIAYMIYFYN
ncbi:MAG: hypothetical protein CMD31_09090 [Flavobacteriales bacterium]|nr:hypothetical protein [Flavobacteriales bacterium]|tara:strand:- start:37521 stop:37964 length:444 start_codon:yes stop_codon:yes gene_type:complete